MSIHSAATGSSKPGKADPLRLSNAAGSPQATVLNVNNISMWAASNGILEKKPQDLSAGVTFPPGTSQVVFAGGFLWCGLVRDGLLPVLRSGGQAGVAGTVPGAIVRPGIRENPGNADVRIYRIRRDWQTADLRRDASELLDLPAASVTAGQIAAVRDQYRKDWLEWPWQKGAPYYERNNRPGYQPDPGGSPDSLSDEPGLAGADEVLWFVANDLDPNSTRQLYGSPPIGLEMQVTCWAFSSRPELRSVVYQRCRIVYRGTGSTPPSAFIDSMYLAKWADADVGDPNDDLAGSIEGRGLGYQYNAQPSDAKYADFNLVPPVVGYDIVQGVRVPQPGAISRWDIRTVPGYTNRPATGFTYFSNGLRPSDYDLARYVGTMEWWNVFRGFRAVPLNPPQCSLDPVTGQCSRFELTGDPRTLEGWVDGRAEAPGDRRFALSSGPFTMALGDTQEIVVALMAALGKDRLDGITALEQTDDAAQDEATMNFVLPDSIPAPDLKIVELDHRLVLDWEKDTAKIASIEKYRSQGYRFETYRIYQFTDSRADLNSAFRFPPFDITTPRFIPLSTDFVRERPLVNGQPYYYAVSAVMLNPDPGIERQRLESPVFAVSGTPHSPNPGTVYPYAAGEPVPAISNFIGVNDAQVTVSYFDPTTPDDHLYKILFHRPHDIPSDFQQKARWTLVDSTTNDTLLRRIRVDTSEARVVTRGFSMFVTSPVNTLRGVFEVRSNGAAVRNSVFEQPNPGENYMIVGPGGTSDLDTLRGGSIRDIDVEFRFNGDSSWAFFSRDLPSTSSWVRVPFTCWGLFPVVIDSPVEHNDTTYMQLYTMMTQTGNDSVWRPRPLIDQTFNDRDVWQFYPITVHVESTYIRNVGWVGGTYKDDIATSPEGPILKSHLWSVTRIPSSKFCAFYGAYFSDLDGDGIAAPRGTVIRFEHNKVVYDGDVKLYRPSRVVHDNLAAAQKEVRRVNVFPNPYYGMNRAEENKLNRFVTFSHLPRFATIRIFNLAGILVKTIRKDDESQFTRWDLNNETGLPAASGLYLAHLELRDINGIDLGTATLKLMIVREEQLFEEN